MGSSSSKHNNAGPNSPYFPIPDRPPAFWTKWNDQRYEEDYAGRYSGGHGRRHDNQAGYGRGGNYSVTPHPPWFSKVAFDRGTKLDPFPGKTQGHGRGHGGGNDSRRDGLGGRPQDGRHHGGGHHHHHHGGERHGGRHHSRHRHQEGEYRGGRHHGEHRHHEAEHRGGRYHSGHRHGHHSGRHHSEHHQTEFPTNKMIEFDNPHDAGWKQEHRYNANAGAFNNYYGPKYYPGIRNGRGG